MIRGHAMLLLVLRSDLGSFSLIYAWLSLLLYIHYSWMILCAGIFEAENIWSRTSIYSWWWFWYTLWVSFALTRVLLAFYSCFLGPCSNYVKLFLLETSQDENSVAYYLWLFHVGNLCISLLVAGGGGGDYLLSFLVICFAFYS